LGQLCLNTAAVSKTVGISLAAFGFRVSACPKQNKKQSAAPNHKLQALEGISWTFPHVCKAPAQYLTHSKYLQAWQLWKNMGKAQICSVHRRS